MRAGIDSYSYHRYFGEIRAGEDAPETRWDDPIGDVVTEVESLGVGVVSLQTSFVGRGSEISPDRIVAAARHVEIIPAWGAPDGLKYGADEEALEDLFAWINLTTYADSRLMRIVLGGPRFRDIPFEERLRQVIDPLKRACDVAQKSNVVLAIENHGEILSDNLLQVICSLDSVDPGSLGVCFDTANALRMGEDVLKATTTLAPYIHMVHLKDVEPLDRQVSSISGPASVPYGTGVIPIAGVIATLSSQGFDGPVCLELGQIAPGDSEITLIQSGIRWLRTAQVIA